MEENNTLNHSYEMTYFNCLVDKSVKFNRLQSEIFENYSELARAIGSSLLHGYKIEKIIDENQFGFTYLAKKVAGGDEQFIIKEFFPQKYVTRGDNDAMLMRASLSIDDLTQFNFLKDFFTGEINNLEKLLNSPHPNLIKVNSITRNYGNTMYSIYSYEEGILLEEYLQEKKGHLKNQEIYNIINPILDAVDHLHTLQICHFDIKPENILIKKDGSLLLLGFEASSLFYDKYDQCYCNAYTPRYAAPEQLSVEKKSSLNKSTDIYAIGALLYCMVTGTFPPKASVRMDEQLIHNKQDPYVPLQEQKMYAKYDITILQSIDKALKFSKRDRFHNIVRLRQSLNSNTVGKNKNYLYVSAVVIGLAVFIGWVMYDDNTEVAADKIQKSPSMRENHIAVKENREQHVMQHTITKIDNQVMIKNKNSGENKDKNRDVSKNEKSSAATPEAIEYKEQRQQDNKTVLSKHEMIVKANKEIANKILDTKIKSNEEKSLDQNETIKLNKPHNNVDVNISILRKYNIGNNKILVNGQVLKEKHFGAYKDKVYHIDILNPYFYPLHEERTFLELKEYPEQTFMLTLGKAKLYLQGLPDNTQIKIHYQTDEDNDTIDEDNTIIHNGIYEVLLSAGKRFYLSFSHKGYKVYNTDIFELKNGEALTQFYNLEKKELTKFQKKEKPIPSTVTEKITKPKKEKPIKKIKNLKPVSEHKKSSKGEDKKKIDMINTKTKKEKFNKQDNKPASKKKSIVTDKKQKIDVKKKTSVQRTVNYVWYCSAAAIGKEKISAKHIDKAIAKHTAIQNCSKKYGVSAGCRVLSCFLIR